MELQHTPTTTPANAAAINLRNLDVRILVDISGSMGEKMKNGQSRYDYCRETIKPFVEQIGALDDDGITLGFFNRSFTITDHVKPETFGPAWDAHAPGGGTMLAEPLQQMLNMAINDMKEKNQFLVILTDGLPDDEAAVQKAIVEASKKMERDEQVGILFVQVGEDPHATAFLHRLDNELAPAGAKFDIVHTEPVDSIAGQPLQAIVDLTFND